MARNGLTVTPKLFYACTAHRLSPPVVRLAAASRHAEAPKVRGVLTQYPYALDISGVSPRNHGHITGYQANNTQKSQPYHRAIWWYRVNIKKSARKRGILAAQPPRLRRSGHALLHQPESPYTS